MGETHHGALPESSGPHRPSAEPPPRKSNDPDAGTTSSPPRANAFVQRVWSSETLFGDTQEVLIEHEGMLYRLRKTRWGRLILQK